MSEDERMPRPADASNPRSAQPGSEAPAVVPEPSPAAPEPPPETPSPAVEPPSADLALADEASPLPGVHRGGFQRLPTAPVEVTTQSAPAEPGTDEDAALAATAQWLLPPTTAPHHGLAGWALAFSIAGLAVSLFVGWGFPIGLVGVVSAILALRRPLESRAVAVWALVVGGVSILYSAGWLLFAASRITASG